MTQSTIALELMQLYGLLRASTDARVKQAVRRRIDELLLVTRGVARDEVPVPLGGPGKEDETLDSSGR